MMNFGSLSTTQVTSTVSKRLKPWGIYPVKFKGIEVRNIQGKKDPSINYEILSVKFEGENGYYNEDIFFPNEKSAVRNTYTTKEGHTKEMPSGFEQTMTLIAQLAGTLNPEGFKKMQAVSSKFKSFNDVCDALGKILKPKIDTECFIKLAGKSNQEGRVQPCLPRIVALNNNGEIFTCDNFISLDKNILGFSEYEETKIKEYQSAKPTNMEKAVETKNDDLEVTGSEDSDDFEDLL